MSFRTRLLISFSAAVILTAGLVTWIVSSATRRAFEQRDNQRTAALVALFRREFARRGDEVVQRVEGLTAAESTLRMAIDLSRTGADPAPYVDEAGALAATYRLDFLELISDDGTIVSSAQWPARFGYKAEWVSQPVDWKSQGAFFEPVELPEETALALVAVRTVSVGEKNLYIVGGYRLDRQFLASFPLPTGMRALLYRNVPPAQVLTDEAGPLANAAALTPLIDRVRAQLRDAAGTVEWPDGPETFQAMPLTGRENNLLGVLLVGSSRRDLAALVREIRRTGALAAFTGILLGAALSFWAARRITRPVERLAAGAREVALGNWNARVEIASRDEIGELARAFNSMTLQLVEQRDHLVQAERVAAWRELARRLAHELKNPLFPLQITIENLQRAKEQAPDQFDEVFRESSETLLAELANLKKIIGRFSDFAKMPPPQLERVDVNDLVRRTMRLFEAQFHAEGRPAIEAQVECAADAGFVEADPEQLSRALQNLALNAIDAMPSGGTLRIRTARRDGTVEIDISDTGQGLTKEECERLFTPYYTTKQHGTGLGLAIVQSVVADHKGKIAVESEPSRGTTFRIELPEKP
jgi:two-component system, NtrC family, nitrogen regulation sensor histidine kinase NtrY